MNNFQKKYYNGRLVSIGLLIVRLSITIFCAWSAWMASPSLNVFWLSADELGLIGSSLVRIFLLWSFTLMGYATLDSVNDIFRWRPLITLGEQGLIIRGRMKAKYLPYSEIMSVEITASRSSFPLYVQEPIDMDDLPDVSLPFWPFQLLHHKLVIRSKKINQYVWRFFGRKDSFEIYINYLVDDPLEIKQKIRERITSNQ